MLLGGTVAAQDVTYDYDRTKDFSGLRTYAWAGGTNLRDELNHQRIVAAVDAQLAARGLVKVDAGADPDVLVLYRVGLEQELEIDGTGRGGRYLGRSGSGSARVAPVVIGTLAVGIVDPRTGAVLWRGAATKELDVKASPEKRERNINKAVEKLFRHYPPGSEPTQPGT